MNKVARILGIDPGLRRTGWGIIEAQGNKLSHVAHGVVVPDTSLSLAARLNVLFAGIEKVIQDHDPNEAAVEHTFVNRNPSSTLKLGQARGVALLVPARAGLEVGEYAPNHIKKSIVGAGHADKQQIHAMVSILLGGVKVSGSDAADALAVAICHAHNRGGQRMMEAVLTGTSQ